MDFEPSEDQRLLKGALRQFLSRRYDFAARISASRSDPGYRPEIWQAFANELGILGATLPVSHGGSGGGAGEQLAIMEEMGRALVIEPVAETLFQAGAILVRSDSETARRLVAAIVEGTGRMAIAASEPGMRDEFADIETRAEWHDGSWILNGCKAVVMTAPWATHLLIAARSTSGLSLFAVPAEASGLTMQTFPTLDERRAADIWLRDVAIGSDAMVGKEGEGLALLEEWRDRAIAAMAAEAVGLLGRLLEDTIAYAKQREQFGQKIGRFQVLQHRMVDMYLHLELVRSAAVLATHKLDAPPMERARAASAAKVTLAKACRFIGQNAVQLHGGMGMTDELPVGHYFKRATVMEQQFGSANWHLARHAALGTTTERRKSCAALEEVETYAH